MKVTTAAIRAGGVNYTMARPARHGHIGQAMVRNGWPRPYPGGDAQGFLLEDGTFARRKVAERYARRSGQLTKPLIGSILTSEDLW